MLAKLKNYLTALIITAPTRKMSVKTPIHHGWLDVHFVGYMMVRVEIRDGAALLVYLDYAIETLAPGASSARKRAISDGLMVWGYCPKRGTLRVYLSTEALINLQAK